jgi:hypothetical protein
MFARVPTPWGAEPKAQIVSGTAASVWVLADQEPPKPVYFDDLFPTDLGIAVLVHNPPVPLALKGLIVSEEDLPPDLKWAVTRGVIKALAPKAFRPQMAARPGYELSVLDLQPQAWGEVSDSFRKFQRQEIKPQLSALPTTKAQWTDLPASRKLPTLKLYRDLPDAPRVAAIRPVMPSSLVRARTAWSEMPPALARWAVEKGIQKAQPPRAPRPVISALPSRKQAALAALRAGEWVKVDELDIFPPRLRRWLEDCGIEFIRCFGWGNAGGQGPTTPVNGYVTEDGQIFYCAEDGSTFYVQET